MAENTTEYSVVLPSILELNFSRNCSLYGQWLYSYITLDQWDQQSIMGGSIEMSLRLFESAVPPGWSYLQNASAEQVATVEGTNKDRSKYYGSVMQWYVDNLYWTNSSDGWEMNPDFATNVIWIPASQCDTEFCRAIAFTGNADLSGVGVLISYLIEATLVTSYLLCFTVSRAYKSSKRHRHQRQRQHHQHHQQDQHKGLHQDQNQDKHQGQHQDENQRKRRRRHFLIHSAGRRVFNAVRGSLAEFLDSAIVFSLSILLAAIVMAAKQAGENHTKKIGNQTVPTGNALYNPVQALMVSLFAIFPVVILHLLAPEHDDDGANTATELLPSHRQHHGFFGTVITFFARAFAVVSRNIAGHRSGSRAGFRRIVLGILWGLCIAVVIVSPHSELDYDDRGVTVVDGTDQELSYTYSLYNCDERHGLTYWRVLKALPYLVIGVPLLWFFLTAILYRLTHRRPDRQLSASAEPPARTLWVFVTAWFCCVFMWTILICFVALRSRIVAAAGNMDNDDDMQFGQVLAIVTWTPTLADLAYLLVFGMEAGLASHLPDDYTVRPITAALSHRLRSAGQPWKKRKQKKKQKQQQKQQQQQQQSSTVSSSAASSSQYTQTDETTHSHSSSTISAQKKSDGSTMRSRSVSLHLQLTERDPEKGQ